MKVRGLEFWTCKRHIAV